MSLLTRIDRWLTLHPKILPCRCGYPYDPILRMVGDNKQLCAYYCPQCAANALPHGRRTERGARVEWNKIQK